MNGGADVNGMRAKARHELAGLRVGVTEKGWGALVSRGTVTAQRLRESPVPLHEGDFTFPLAVIDRAALLHNIGAMASWCSEHGMQIAPHGKTSMAPQLIARDVGGKLHEREVLADLDRPEVLAPEATLVRERADDLARLDPLPTTHRDAVGREVRVAARTTLAPALAALAVTVAVAVGPLAAHRLGLGLHQQRRLTLRDHGERGGHVGLGNVVVRDVVRHDVAEEADALRIGQGGGNTIIGNEAAAIGKRIAQKDRELKASEAERREREEAEARAAEADGSRPAPLCLITVKRRSRMRGSRAPVPAAGSPDPVLPGSRSLESSARMRRSWVSAVRTGTAGPYASRPPSSGCCAI